MAPTLGVADYQHSDVVVADSTTLTSASFTPSNGDVIVITASTYDTSITPGTPSGGSQTFTQRVDNGPGGFNGHTRLYTAVVSGSPGAMTVTLGAPSTNCFHDMALTWWTAAQLAGTPAVGSNAGSGAASGTITTVANGSIVVWAINDVNSVNPATRAYLSSATEIGVGNGSVNSNAVFYNAYQSAPTAGSQTFGLSAPTGMAYVTAAVEIQAASGGGGTGPPGRPPFVFPALAATQASTW